MMYRLVKAPPSPDIITFTQPNVTNNNTRSAPLPTVFTGTRVQGGLSDQELYGLPFKNQTTQFNY